MLGKIKVEKKNPILICVFDEKYMDYRSNVADHLFIDEICVDRQSYDGNTSNGRSNDEEI